MPYVLKCKSIFFEDDPKIFSMKIPTFQHLLGTHICMQIHVCIWADIWHQKESLLFPKLHHHPLFGFLFVLCPIWFPWTSGIPFSPPLLTPWKGKIFHATILLSLNVCVLSLQIGAGKQNQAIIIMVSVICS